MMIDSYNFYACRLFLSRPHETEYGICVTKCVQRVSVLHSKLNKTNWFSEIFTLEKSIRFRHISYVKYFVYQVQNTDGEKDEENINIRKN